MDSNSVRVRFAPSPTGYLHVGGLRTALFNYLFARHNKGKFILRIEDTDRSRLIEGAVDSLIKTMNDVGLEYDEGPGSGGDFGPYFQSQRLDIYRDLAGELLKNGHAYRCFCTPKRLDDVRDEQRKQGKQTQYDRYCRSLGEKEVSEKLKNNVPHVVRLKVPLDSEVSFNDIIRGKVSIGTDQVDDQVLIKSDGFPTYHLANVIDDHMMKITHVIRGEEWLTSVPKHVLLYKAFGWEVPELAHVPLILNSDRTKLSKRQGDVATEDFLKKGYLKEALINFISLLGWNPGEGEKREIFSRGELIEMFSLERVNPSGAVFNMEKLNWMNAEYIRNYPLDELAELITPFLENAGYSAADHERTRRLVDVTRFNLNRLDEIGMHAEAFYKSDLTFNEDQKQLLKSDTSKKVLSSLAAELEKESGIEPDRFKDIINKISKETGLKGPALFHPVRLVLTGEDQGPQLGQIAYVLGKDEVLRKIKKWS